MDFIGAIEMLLLLVTRRNHASSKGISLAANVSTTNLSKAVDLVVLKIVILFFREKTLDFQTFFSSRQEKPTKCGF